MNGEINTHCEDISLTHVELLNWLLLLLLSAGAYIFQTIHFAQSVLIGGLVANMSFRFLRRDLTKLFNGPLAAVKIRFFLLYYVRLSAVIVVLFLLVKNQYVNTLGLLVGLSTVLLSIAMTAAAKTKKIFFKMREAS